MQNIVILAGTIRQAPETRTTRTGTDVTRFKLVTSRPRYSEGRIVRDEKGYRVEDAEWHRVVAFNGLGRTIQHYCESGMKVLVRGRIHYTKWQDAEGQDRYGCEIVAETVDFLSRAQQTETDDEDEGRFIDEDDIPS
ncbi:single-stranded DNA-binding protein [Paracoccus aminovorans]|uniref:single-stranded DNA-binding protein n=1 Tax=Paracoccus aminovorans TaxID=34004 RepID=UPI0007847DA8|nr:single-stranded DNA-binding protein [Paracoccus aminovorans]